MRDFALKVIYDAIDELNEELEGDEQIEKSES